MLREDEEAAQAEVTLAKEKVHLLEAEVGDLTQHRDEAKEEYELIREQHRLGLLPQIQQLQEVRLHHSLAVVFCPWHYHFNQVLTRLALFFRRSVQHVPT